MRRKPKRLPLTVDPFGRVKRHFWKRGQGVRLRVNLKQASAFRPGSRRVDFRQFNQLRKIYPSSENTTYRQTFRRAGMALAVEDGVTLDAEAFTDGSTMHRRDLLAGGSLT